MFNQYPYLNINDLNLDYLLRAIKEMRYEVTNFVSLNAIKYADPIQWDITRQYEKNTIVIDPLTGVAYISVQPVPRGVALTRDEYWTVVFDLGRFVARAAQNFTDHYEPETTLISSYTLEIGDWVVWGDVLYKAIEHISIGEYYVVGTNIEHFTMRDLYDEYLATVADILALVGDLVDLNTSDKTSIVNAINSILADYEISFNTRKLFVGEDVDSWVDNHRGEQYDNDTILSVSPSGKTGVAGFTRTKDNPNAFDYGTIGVTGIAQSDKDVSDTCVSWGGYFENRRIGNSSTSYGIEVDSGRYDTNKEVFNPYDTSSDQNMCVTANLSSGCGDNESNGADTALWIHANPVPFKQGIVFSENSVENGRPSIALPWGATISWQAGNLDNALMQFISGAVLYLQEITAPNYAKINLNSSNVFETLGEGATLGCIEFANNGTTKVEIRGTEDNGGTITFLLPNGRYALLNQYWLSLPNMWVDCAKVQANTAAISGAIEGGTIAGSTAYIDKEYVAGLYVHSVPLTTVKAIANDLRDALKAYWVNNKCSMTVSREDIITIFTTHGWDALDTNILTGDTGQYVNQSELDLWISYADPIHVEGDVRYDDANQVYQYYHNGAWTNIT